MRECHRPGDRESADSLQSSFNNKYTLLVAGEIILGLGSAIQDICQYKLYPHWFAGSHMVSIASLKVSPRPSHLSITLPIWRRNSAFILTTRASSLV